MFRIIAEFRIFFIVAIFASAVVELWSGMPDFSSSVQLGICAFVGLLGLAAARATHIV